MNATLSERLTAEFDSQLKPHINILLLYQDAVSGQRALGLYNRLLQQLLPNYQFHLNALGFDRLRSSEIQDAAVQKAVDADLIIVSAYADRDLPQHIQNCFSLWLDRRTETSQALVAMLCGSPSETVTDSSAYDYLRRLSDEAGISLFADISTASRTDLAPDLLTLMEQPLASSRWLDQILRRSYPVQHWGLNE